MSDKKDPVVIYRDEARSLMLSGVNKLSDAVVSTLGPSGRNVVINTKSGAPISTKDGVTVAKNFRLPDSIENIASNMVKQAAIRTADVAGDGTTTSTILAKNILEGAINYIKNSPDGYVNVSDLKKGIDAQVTEVLNMISEKSKEINDEDQVYQIAKVSSNNDDKVGKLISKAISKVGRDGVVTIEDSKTTDSYLDVVEGMEFDRGYKSPYFVTDNNTMTAVMSNPMVMITDRKLSSMKDVTPFLEYCNTKNKPAIIIADDITHQALSLMVVNKSRGNLEALAVKAPGHANNKKDLLEDIAAITGGKVISEDKAMKVAKFDPSWIGNAAKITSTKDKTTIIDGKGDSKDIADRVDNIKNQIEKAKTIYTKEILQDRLAKLVGGIAVVNVGGKSEVESRERKFRVEDSLHATQAAIQDGILPGGGTSLLKISHILGGEPFPTVNTNVFNSGKKIVLEAIRSPYRQIMANAGLHKDVIDKAANNTVALTGDINPNDWSRSTIEVHGELKELDLYKEGIIDPSKVTKTALVNAASVASTMLTTDCIIDDVDESSGDENGIDLQQFGM